MKTKLRLPSPTSLTDRSEKLLPRMEERAGTALMYSIRDLSSSGRNSEKAIVTGGDSGGNVTLTFGRETLTITRVDPDL